MAFSFLRKVPKLSIYFKMSIKKSNLLHISFQFECCGVHSSEDFSQATEFLKYARDEGEGQIIPEACCMLADSSTNGELFTPRDVNCISTPTTSNSYMSRVSTLQYTVLQGVQDPNLKFQTTKTQKLCISDRPIIGKANMILELEHLFTF